jgi:phospholipid transport system substrate-binding protein
MMKHWLAAVFTAVSLALAGPASATLKAPDETIKTAVDEIQDLLGKNHAKYEADKSSYFQMVNEKIVPHFDVPYIARSVLARNWKAATEPQRTRFQEAFKNMLIRSYADAMLENYDMVRAEWKPLRLPEGATDVLVSSSLIRQGKQPVTIGFAMHAVGPGPDWKIYDITVENLSLIQNFRGQFAAELKKTTLDELIQRMETGRYSTGTPQTTGSAAGQGTARP